jgi:hypothetical protein
MIASFFMEDFEEAALKRATIKPLCWFRYMDDTLMILPSGQEKLDDFHHHLSSIHSNM